jgi:hypothetical protein
MLIDRKTDETDLNGYTTLSLRFQASVLQSEKKSVFIRLIRLIRFSILFSFWQRVIIFFSTPMLIDRKTDETD